MKELCEQCPLRGDMQGEMQGILITSCRYEVRATLGYGPLTDRHDGLVGVLYDERGNVSEPLKLPAGAEEAHERIAKRIDACLQPETEERGLFRKETYVTGCPALGHLVIRNDMIRRQIKNAARVELT